MKKISFLVLISVCLFFSKISFSQVNDLCTGSFPFCTDTVYNFPAGVNAGTAQTGPDYTCLYTQPNPAWYYMQVLNTGPIVIYMSSVPNVDIDFSCWGPFTDQTTPCTAQLTAGTTVDCSYSTSWNETCDIPNAQAGEFYILLITNYSNSACNIIFTQSNATTPGHGTTNCGILAPPVSNNGPLCVGATLNLTAQSGPTGCTYSWTGPNAFVSTQQNPIITNVTMAMAGDYYLQVILAGDTSNAVSTTVVINPIPTSTFTVSLDSVCINETTTINYTGTASATATYTWDVDGGTPNLNIGPGPHDISWGGSGLVNVSLTVVENGCTSPPTNIPVFVKPIPTSLFNIALNDTICLNDTLSISYAGTAVANATYNWNFTTYAHVISGSGQGPYQVNWSVPGLYSLSLSVSQDGCPSDTTFKTVTVLPLPVIYINAHPKEGCNPITVSFNDSTANAAHWNWTFNGGNPGTSTNENPINIMYNNPGSFNVILHVEDIYGCKNTKTFNNYITSYPEPVASFTFSPNPGAPSLPISFNSSASSSYVTSWNWDFGDASTSTLQNPTHSYAQAGTNTIWLVVETAHGCIDSTSDVIKIVDVQIPNVFTPNGDGVNEVFFIKGIEAVTDCQLIVFNRWGNKVFESNGYKNDWDGKGAADGVYFFIITFKDNLIKKTDNSFTNTMSGTVTIVRN